MVFTSFSTHTDSLADERTKNSMPAAPKVFGSGGTKICTIVPEH